MDNHAAGAPSTFFPPKTAPDDVFVWEQHQANFGRLRAQTLAVMDSFARRRRRGHVRLESAIDSPEAGCGREFGGARDGRWSMTMLKITTL